jgi:hypothetical protein
MAVVARKMCVPPGRHPVGLDSAGRAAANAGDQDMVGEGYRELSGVDEPIGWSHELFFFHRWASLADNLVNFCEHRLWILEDFGVRTAENSLFKVFL